MNFRPGLSAFGLAIALPAATLYMASAAGSSGMPAMQYYVGSWMCTGGATGHPAKGSIQYQMDGSALRDTVVAEATPGKVSRAWLTVETKYDAANHRYVNTAFDNGGWDVSWASPWTGNTEHWTDHS